MSVNQKGNVVEVGWLGTADWSPDNTILIHSLQFIASLASDIFVVRNFNAAGPEIYRHDTLHTEKIKYFPNSLMRPYIDISEATLSCASVAKLIIIKQDEERI
jgi:hypothetical protein